MNDFYENINNHIDNIISKPTSKKKKNIMITIYSNPKVEHIKLNKEDINKIKKQPLGDELIKFIK